MMMDDLEYMLCEDMLNHVMELLLSVPEVFGGDFGSCFSQFIGQLNKVFTFS